VTNSIFIIDYQLIRVLKDCEEKINQQVSCQNWLVSPGLLPTRQVEYIQSHEYILKTYPKIRKPLFHIQKPAVFEYEKVNFPGFRIDTKERTHWLKRDDGELR
jgi:hypothetical protein